MCLRCDTQVNAERPLFSQLLRGFSVGFPQEADDSLDPWERIWLEKGPPVWFGLLLFVFYTRPTLRPTQGSGAVARSGWKWCWWGRWTFRAGVREPQPPWPPWQAPSLWPAVCRCDRQGVDWQVWVCPRVVGAGGIGAQRGPGFLRRKGPSGVSGHSCRRVRAGSQGARAPRRVSSRRSRLSPRRYVSPGAKLVPGGARPGKLFGGRGLAPGCGGQLGAFSGKVPKRGRRVRARGAGQVRSRGGARACVRPGAETRPRPPGVCSPQAPARRVPLLVGGVSTCGRRRG